MVKKKFDKGWILLSQNEASSGYKHDENTPGLCITKMHTANTNTHTNNHAGKKQSRTRPKLCLDGEKKQSDRRSTAIHTNYLLTSQGQREWFFNGNASRKGTALKRRRGRIQQQKLDHRFSP
jgi:hypothetical protein